MKRKYLRKKIQEVLKAAKIPGVDQDVFCRKSSSHDDGELPYICIYSNTENAQRFDESPKRYKRSLEIVIECITAHDTDELLCDEMDELSYHIETAIESDDVLQGFKDFDKEGHCVEDTEITSVQYDSQADGSSPMGAVRLTYSITYVDKPVTQKVHNTLNTVETQWEIGDHEENKAIDLITIPQE
jgi:hypothetical protein